MKEKLCAVNGCFEVHRSKGYCSLHYQRHLKGTSLNSPKKLPAKGKECSIKECHSPVRCRMLCSRHYNRAVKQETCPGCGGPRWKRSLMCQSCWIEESQKHIPTSKICTLCNIEKPVDDFGLRKVRQGAVKWRSRCRTCEAAEQRERTKQKKLAGTLGARDRSSEKKNATILKMKKYCESLNLPWEEIIQRYPENGLCEICESEPIKPYGRLSLDHDHKTGGFRGFICSNCNMGLGLLKDNLTVLQSAIEYLQKPQITSIERELHEYQETEL